MTIENHTDVQSAAGTQKPIEIPCEHQSLEDDANADSAKGVVGETRCVGESALLSKQDGELHEDTGCIGNQGNPGMKVASVTVLYK